MVRMGLSSTHTTVVEGVGAGEDKEVLVDGDVAGIRQALALLTRSHLQRHRLQRRHHKNDLRQSLRLHRCMPQLPHNNLLPRCPRVAMLALFLNAPNPPPYASLDSSAPTRNADTLIPHLLLRLRVVLY